MSSQSWRVSISKIFWPSHVMDLFGVYERSKFNFRQSALAYYIYKKSLTKAFHLLQQIDSVKDGHVEVRPIVFTWHCDEYGGPQGIRSSNIVFFKKEIIQIYKELEDECKGFKELDSLITDIPTLEQDQQEGSQGMKWYGLIAVVEQCRKEGLTPQETAARLKDAGASLAVIGGLLHPQGDIADWTQYGKNLLAGRVKNLPW